MDSKMCVSFCVILGALLSLSAAVLLSPPDLIGSRLFEEKSATDEKMTKFRLPENVKPKEYGLKVITNLEPDFTFSGSVTIKVQVDSPTQYIVLNSKKLNIVKVEVRNQRGFPIRSNFTLDEPNEQLSIFCPELSVRKDYTVLIDFEGVLADDMHGYYRSSYKIKDTKKWLAITQFEATSARKAFPCFDEPRYKTPYTIELAISQGQTALSNMPIESTSAPQPSIGNRVWAKFQKSEPMPTYLVAYSVSTFAVYKKENERVRVWSRENAIDDCHYIQEKGELLLKAMEAYLGIGYKLPKLDIVAVPDFAAGAMENYGLTTYRQKLVELVDGVSTEKETEYAVTVVAHEFSHQWFGDMVTPAWWDYTWLNEAFARYFQYYLADLVQSDWKMSELFVVEQVQTAMLADLKGAHPITAKVNSPEEINDIFDQIIYNKGGSVLRMLEHYITPATFQSALSTYLDSTYTGSAQGVTDPGNLFEAITDTINAMTNQNWHDTMGKFKDKWIDQAGYPLVTVTRNYAEKRATVSQQQFLFEADETASERRWLIPLTYTTSNEKNFTLEEAKKRMIVFDPAEKTAVIADVQSARWLILNIQEIGFYRVNYDQDNWKEIIATLWKNPRDIHHLNRAQLIDDSFNLARAGIISYATPMTLSKYLVQEMHPLPWLAAFPNFRFLLTRYRSHLLAPLKKHFAPLVKSKYQDSVARLNRKELRDHTDKAALNTIAQWACALDIDSCVNQAKSEMAKLVANPDYKIDADIRESVLCTGLRLGGEAEWNAVWNHYLKTDVATEKVLTLTQLPCSTHKDALESLINAMTGGETIRSQDFMYLARSIAAQAHHIHPALKILREKYHELTEPNGDRVWKLLINQLKHAVTTESELQEIKTLAASNETEHHHAHMLNHTIDYIEKNFGWQEQNLATLKKWLEDDQNPDNPTPAPGPGPGPSPNPTNKPSSAAKPFATLVSCSLAFFVLYRKFGSFVL